MGKTKFKLNLAGLNALMQSDEMKDQLQAAGEAVASAADGNYGVRVHDADYTSIANVYPEDPETYQKNMNNNELLKAVGAVGLSMTKKK